VVFADANNPVVTAPRLDWECLAADSCQRAEYFWFTAYRLPHIIAQFHFEPPHILLLFLCLFCMEPEKAVDSGKGDTVSLGDNVAPAGLLYHLLDGKGGLFLTDLQ